MDEQKGESKPTKQQDLEIKDAQLIFRKIWSDLEKKHTQEKLQFPREMIWLGGAPGAGKGTNTPFIMEMRGITAPPVVISSLLDTPHARALKDAGVLVGDREVINLLFEELLKPKHTDGVIIDGFPRTKVQVEVLKLFYEKLIYLYQKYSETPLEGKFKKPIFHIVLLFVDQKTSVARQLHRGVEVKEHNEKVRESGVGELLEERATDYSEELARNRYRVFRDTTYEALQSLRKKFYYHFLDASQKLENVQDQISREFQYQSSLELSPETFDRICGIPIATELIKHARQELVNRLDGYEREHSELFGKVVDIIQHKFFPIISRYAIGGHSMINSEDTTFNDPLALAMLIDVFSERGYHITVDINRIDVPERISPETHKIICRTKIVYRFHIRFRGTQIYRKTFS